MSPQGNKDNLVARPFNQILAQKHALLKNAVRFAIGTVCGRDGKPIAPTVKPRTTLKTIPFDIAAAGDNIIIPALAGVKQIYEFVLWNVGAQDILIQQGQTGSANFLPLLTLPSFPATTGITLGFNGNFDQSHWDIDNDQPLVINLSAGTRVTGFIRYRVANGLLA